MPTVLITGASQGIGLELCRQFMERGYDVIATCRRASDGLRALDCGIVEDVEVTDDASVERLATALGGRNIDVLVNNAGILHEVSLLSPASDFAEAMEVMVAAPLDLIRLCTPRWRETGWGRIVNVSSGWGSFAEGLEGPGAYGVAKAALNALTRTLPRDLPPGVKVNAMCPGWVATRMGGRDAPLAADEGADTALWLATLPDDGPTGGFFRGRAPIAW